jgi:MFS family permease
MLKERPIVVAVSYSILGILPLFLVSAQAVQLQSELGFGKARLGLAVSLCFAASAVAAAPLGRLVERVGPGAGLRLSASLSLAACLCMGLLASRWSHVAAALVLCGIANATAQIATNVTLAGAVVPERQGVAFGAKQAAVPLASLSAGLALPAVALVAGWRAGFAAAAVLAVGALLLLRLPRRRERTAGAAGAARRPRTPVLALTAAAGLLGGAVGNSIPAFAVDSAVSHGLLESTGAAILAAGSLAAVVVRVSTGWIADRRASAGYRELAALTAAGAVALAALALSGGSDALFVAATIAAFATGWGWPGIIYYATVRSHRATPGAATGTVLSAVYVGNVIGPVTVGFIAEHASYANAWALCAGVLGVATAAALCAGLLDRRRLRLQPSRPVAS